MELEHQYAQPISAPLAPERGPGDFSVWVRQWADEIGNGRIRTKEDVDGVIAMAENMTVQLHYSNGGLETAFFGPDGERLDPDAAARVWYMGELRNWTLTEHQKSKLQHVARLLSSGWQTELDVPGNMQHAVAEARTWLGSLMGLSNPYRYTFDVLATMARQHTYLNEDIKQQQARQEGQRSAAYQPAEAPEPQPETAPEQAMAEQLGEKGIYLQGGNYTIFIPEDETDKAQNGHSNGYAQGGNQYAGYDWRNSGNGHNGYNGSIYSGAAPEGGGSNQDEARTEQLEYAHPNGRNGSGYVDPDVTSTVPMARRKERGEGWSSPSGDWDIMPAMGHRQPRRRWSERLRRPGRVKRVLARASAVALMALGILVPTTAAQDGNPEQPGASATGLEEPRVEQTIAAPEAGVREAPAPAQEERLVKPGRYDPEARTGAIQFMVEDYAAEMDYKNLTPSQIHELTDRTIGYMNDRVPGGMSWEKATQIRPDTKLPLPPPDIMQKWLDDVTSESND